MDEDQICELKKKINEFIWQNAPGDMTMERAEQAAIALLEASIAMSRLFFWSRNGVIECGPQSSACTASTRDGAECWRYIGHEKTGVYFAA